jgi:branched-chain amino acid transport system ATP-binding protein
VEGKGNIRSLSTRALSVRFGGITALQDVDFCLVPGEIVGLIGPNGAGKTTLVNCLTGYQEPAAGQIHVNGVCASGWMPPDFCVSGVTRTFQGGRLFADLTVSENIEVPIVVRGFSRRRAKKAVMELLGRLQLADIAGKMASTLPYTDERRVGIARALATQPLFLLLDEPAAGMSDQECEELMNVVRVLPIEFGCGVLLIEHNMTVVTSLSDRIHVLDGGRTLAEGTSREIRQNAVVIDAYLGREI